MFWVKALSYLCGVVSTIILAQEAQKYLDVDISLGILPAASAYSKNAFHMIHSLMEREAVNEDVAVFETLFVDVANASRPNCTAYVTSPVPTTTRNSEELPVVDQVTHTTKDSGGASYPKFPGWPSQCYPRYMTAVMIRFWLPLLLHIAHVLRPIFERLSTLIWDPPIFDEFKRSVRMDGWGFPSLAFSSPTASPETPGTVLNSLAMSHKDTYPLCLIILELISLYRALKSREEDAKVLSMCIQIATEHAEGLQKQFDDKAHDLQDAIKEKEALALSVEKLETDTCNLSNEMANLQVEHTRKLKEEKDTLSAQLELKHTSAMETTEAQHRRYCAKIIDDLETKHNKGLADVQSNWNKDFVKRTKEQATLIEEIKSNCATKVKAKEDEASGEAIECVRLTREMSKLKEKHETELAYLKEKFHGANLEAQSYKNKAAKLKIDLEVARDALDKEIGRVFDSDAAKGELEKEIEEKDRVIEEKEKVIEKHLETISLLNSTNATGTVAPVAPETSVDDAIAEATGDKGEDEEGEPSETHPGKLSAGAALFVPSQASSPSQGPLPTGGALPTGGPCPVGGTTPGEGPTPLPPPFHQNGFRGGGVPNLQNPPRQPNAAGQMFTPKQGRVSNRQRSQQRQPQYGFGSPFPSSLSGMRGSRWLQS